jgi:hypothetical protein
LRRVPAFLFLLILTPFAAGQGTKADYDRANSVRKWTAGKVANASIDAYWTPDGNSFWYSRTADGKQEFVLVDCANGTREVVEKDKLPKDAKRSGPPRKKFGREEGPAPELSEAAGEGREFFVLAQPPRRGGTSPDGKCTAFTRDNNVFIRDIKTREETQLSKDGKADDSYGRVIWSPDEEAHRDSHEGRRRPQGDAGRIIPTRPTATEDFNLRLPQAR